MKIKNKDGNTPLHLTAIYNLVLLIKILLEKGADINVTNREGDIVLHLAASLCIIFSFILWASIILFSYY
ncbi:MAG: ankyrin repeat domain-containing protein [Burkholderiales bacterium]